MPASAPPLVIARRAAFLIFAVACFFVPALLLSAAVEPAQFVNCPACRGTATCQANGCKEGKMLCPATCLKLDAPGWIKKKIDGYPDDYIWMPFRWKVGDDSGTQYYSQNHAGELIEYENGKPVNRGRCPKCEGSSRVACTRCSGDAKCRTCSGAGKFVRDQQLFTLTDAQGRELEAIVLSRRDDAITVMRLADQKVFDLPLAKLSVESTERIEQRFPAAR